MPKRKRFGADGRPLVISRGIPVYDSSMCIWCQHNDHAGCGGQADYGDGQECTCDCRPPFGDYR